MKTRSLVFEKKNWQSANFRIRVSQTISTIFFAIFLNTIVNRADAQTTLVNGANQTGIIFTNTVADTYIFTANAGDTINLRLGTTNFFGQLRLFGPNAALLATASNSQQFDARIMAYVATNSGTFTVQVSSYSANGSGKYELHLIHLPDSFIVPSGDQGGAMTNGDNYPGTLTVGDLDAYTFSANAGDSINLRMGSTNFFGQIWLFGPNGALLTNTGSTGDQYDVAISYIATNSGTFAALVCSYELSSHNGTYELHVISLPGAFMVPAGDQGGPMTNGGNYTGTITLGDLDAFTFNAYTNSQINLVLHTTNFFGQLRLYGPSGTLLVTGANSGQFNIPISYTATNSGNFTALVSSYGSDSGTYGLTATGIPGKLLFSSSIISGTNFIINGVGGASNVVYVLY
jgi:hypothetical protein